MKEQVRTQFRDCGPAPSCAVHRERKAVILVTGRKPMCVECHQSWKRIRAELARIKA